MSYPRFSIVATPGTPGVALFQNALQKQNISPAKLITYEHIINCGLDKNVLRNSMVRIDSPGRNKDVFAAILSLGAEPLEESGQTPCTRVDGYEHGKIINPRRWYLGFRRILRTISEHADLYPDIQLLSDPTDIALMFHKAAAHRALRNGDLPVAKSLGSPHDYDDLIERMKRARRSRVFIKLNNGSAASGLIALARSNGQVMAHTTVEAVRDGSQLTLYNTRKIRLYRKESIIASIVNVLCGYGVHVEEWIPKLGVLNKVCDLRVLVIAGKPSHFVLRLSKGPFTNLHLKNERSSVEPLVEKIGEVLWQKILATCKSCAALFPRTLHIALDIAVDISKEKHFILEVNAFGDHLNNLSPNGFGPHDAQVACLLAKCIKK